MGGWVGTLHATTVLEGLLNSPKSAQEETTVLMINLKFFLRSFLRLRYEKIVQIYYRTIPSTQINATIHNQTASSDTEVRVSPPSSGPVQL